MVRRRPFTRKDNRPAGLDDADRAIAVYAVTAVWYGNVRCRALLNRTITNVSTGDFPASTAGNADINAMVKLPQPCIAPIVFVFGAPNVGWFAATGS